MENLEELGVVDDRDRDVVMWDVHIHEVVPVFQILLSLQPSLIIDQDPCRFTVHDTLQGGHRIAHFGIECSICYFVENINDEDLFRVVEIREIVLYVLMGIEVVVVAFPTQ